MKISRIRIQQFAVEEYPEVEKNDVSGNDLLIKGGNRSGKTLTLNALLYGLFGPRATFGVQPGRHSDVQIHFDNGDELHRSSGGREFTHDGNTYTLDEAEEQLQQLIGSESLVHHQFIHSETDKLPLASLGKEELIATVRRLVESDVQEQIEKNIQEKEDLEAEIEQVQRTELKPRRRELEDLHIRQVERQLEKIEKLQSLIDTGRIETIKQRLLENEEINEQLDELYSRKRTIDQELRKLNRKLREEQQYTQEVNNLILDAIEELTCPVCDQVVEEDTARRRMSRGQCPHCGRERSLEELKQNLEQKIDRADNTISDLEARIEELNEEKEEIEEEIETHQSSIPDLSDLNQLTKLTLRENDYDLDAVAERTQQELEQHREEVDRLKNREQQLEDEIKSVEAEIEEMKTAHEQLTQRIQELQEESFNKIVLSFQERWSENYQQMAQDLGLEIHIEQDGSVRLPGNEGPRNYSEVSTGEARLLNLSFSYTVAQTAAENDATDDSLETIFLDEPFANLEDEKRDSALQFIQDSDIQFVITSSNKSLGTRFNPSQVKSLDQMPIQLTWDDIE